MSPPSLSLSRVSVVELKVEAARVSVPTRPTLAYQRGLMRPGAITRGEQHRLEPNALLRIPKTEAFMAAQVQSTAVTASRHDQWALTPEPRSHGTKHHAAAAPASDRA